MYSSLSVDFLVVVYCVNMFLGLSVALSFIVAFYKKLKLAV